MRGRCMAGAFLEEGNRDLMKDGKRKVWVLSRCSENWCCATAYARFSLNLSHGSYERETSAEKRRGGTTTWGNAVEMYGFRFLKEHLHLSFKPFPENGGKEATQHPFESDCINNRKRFAPGLSACASPNLLRDSCKLSQDGDAPCRRRRFIRDWIPFHEHLVSTRRIP